MFKYFRDLLQTLHAIEVMMRMICDRLDRIDSCIVSGDDHWTAPRIRIDPNKY